MKFTVTFDDCVVQAMLAPAPQALPAAPAAPPPPPVQQGNPSALEDIKVVSVVIPKPDGPPTVKPIPEPWAALVAAAVAR